MEGRNDLLEAISNKKKLFGILSMEGNVSDILKEGINSSELKIECTGETDILMINSIKVVLKHKIPSPINLEPDTIKTILAIIVLEEYCNGRLSLADNILSRFVSKLINS